MPEKISIEQVNELDREEFVARFGLLFEHSPWVVEQAWHKRPFGTVSELHDTFLKNVYDAPPERQLGLIRAHPDLAGKAAMEGMLTPESAREQVSAGLDRLTSEEYERFHRLNGAYREKFGFPVVVAVREHTKETILADVEARLKHSRAEEIETALAEISKISHLRLRDQVEPDSGGDSGTGGAK